MPQKQHPHQFGAPLSIPQHPTAPYQRVGDPLSAQARQFPDDEIKSIVPPASKLPPPKLNQHSSALLNLFKSPNPTPISEVSSAPQNLNEDTRQELSATTPATARRAQPSLPSEIGISHLMSSTPALGTPSGPSDALKRSQKQEALLSLFKSSPIPPKPSPSLAPPSDPVELSAQQSPTHLRTTMSHEKRNERAFLDNLANGKVTIKKRADRTSVTPNQAPSVSATVSGPLNVPQFEKILRKASDSKAKSGHMESEKPSEVLDTPRPLKILSRPPDANQQPQNVVSPSKSPRPRVKDSPRRPKRTVPKNSPKLFQPQILKRPAEVATSPQTIPPPTLITKDSTMSEHRPSHTQEQKAALLSLFGRANSSISPLPPLGMTVVSPLSEKPGAGSALPSPLGVSSRSRLGSLNSLGANEQSGGQTPKATASPTDKKFLLGYLDEVAQEGRT